MESVNQPTIWKTSAQAAQTSPRKTSGAPGNAGSTVPAIPSSTRTTANTQTGFSTGSTSYPTCPSTRRHSSRNLRLCKSPSRTS